MLAVLHKDDRLIIVNCSKTNLIKNLSAPTSPISKTLMGYRKAAQPAAEDLLSKCKAISQKGFVTTMRPVDTGIGYTFETLLGIEANSSSAPDYRGIEIKNCAEKKK